MRTAHGCSLLEWYMLTLYQYNDVNIGASLFSVGYIGTCALMVIDAEDRARNEMYFELALIGVCDKWSEH